MSSKNPCVSVIVPVYNTEKYLRECLDSVANQTLRDIEIVCVDDGSTDGSLEILNEYAKKDNRFAVLHQDNAGAGAARNKGIDTARGKYLYFLDSDDYCDVTLLEKTVQKAEETGACLVVFDHYRQYMKSGKKEYASDINSDSVREDGFIYNYATVPDKILTAFNVVPWNKLVLREFILGCHIKFDNLPSSNDITFSVCLSAMCGIYGGGGIYACSISYA